MTGGMGQLVTAIAATLPPATVRTESVVTAIDSQSGGGYTVRLATGESLSAAALHLGDAGPCYC
ncbi:MAG: FAD-dependent oxidoreductase [Caldilineaceae bacterium]